MPSVRQRAPGPRWNLPGMSSALYPMTELRITAFTTFEDVYQHQWLPLVRLATLTTGSLATAEEIVQEAFVSLYRRWDAIDHPGAYVRIAVIHGCTDWVRRRQVERRHLQSRVSNAGLDAPEMLDDVLGRLSPRQRAAVVLRFYEDWSEASIAEALRCRTGTVKSILHRSMQQLRKELAP